MDDGSCLAFFEVPGKPFEFKRQDALDLHIALDVESEAFDRMLNKAQTEGVEVRGPVDHGFVRSIYMRDPNGYVVELTANTGVQQEIMDPVISRSRAKRSPDGRRAKAADDQPRDDWHLGTLWSPGSLGNWPATGAQRYSAAPTNPQNSAPDNSQRHTPCPGSGQSCV
jgi:hypothetical protein